MSKKGTQELSCSGRRNVSAVLILDSRFSVVFLTVPMQCLMLNFVFFGDSCQSEKEILSSTVTLNISILIIFNFGSSNSLGPCQKRSLKLMCVLASEEIV